MMKARSGPAPGMLRSLAPGRLLVGRPASATTSSILHPPSSLRILSSCLGSGHGSPSPLMIMTTMRRGYASANESLLGDKNDIFTRAYEQVKQKEEAAGERPRITEVKAQTKNLPTSLKRVDHLLRQIRRLSYREAIIQLRFSQRRIAPKLIEAIEKARYTAEVKHGLDPERLLLDEIYATKGQYGAPRIDYKAKGRIGIMRRKKVHLTVRLKEMPHKEGEKRLGKFARGVNSEERKAWAEKRDRVAKEMGVHPLVVTTKQVELWDLYKEKILNKRNPPVATDATTSPTATAAGQEASA